MRWVEGAGQWASGGKWGGNAGLVGGNDAPKDAAGGWGRRAAGRVCAHDCKHHPNQLHAIPLLLNAGSPGADRLRPDAAVLADASGRTTWHPAAAVGGSASDTQPTFARCNDPLLACISCFVYLSDHNNTLVRCVCLPAQLPPCQPSCRPGVTIELLVGWVWRGRPRKHACAVWHELGLKHWGALSTQRARGNVARTLSSKQKGEGGGKCWGRQNHRPSVGYTLDERGVWKRGQALC